MTSTSENFGNISQEPVSLWIEQLAAADHDAASRLWAHFCQRLMVFARSRMSPSARRIYDEEDAAASVFRSLCRGIEAQRFPEAEWEYACRASSSAAYCFGDTAESLGEYAWYNKNAGKETHPVGEKKPNRWGLYDMHGKVWEWCQDWMAIYPPGASTDPQGLNGGASRVAHGGSWRDVSAGCRAAIRGSNDPADSTSDCGFRIALNPSVK